MSAGAPRRSPRAASGRCPRACRRPGAVICGDAAGFVNVPKLKGVHYAMRSRHAGRRDDLRGAQARRGRPRRRPARSACTTPRCATARSGPTCTASATCARPSRRASSSAARSPGRWTPRAATLPPGRLSTAPRRRAAAVRRRERRYPAPDGKLTFDKLSSVFLSATAAATTSPTTSASSTACRASSSDRRGPRCARRSVYEVGAEGRRDGLVELRGHAVELRPVRRDHRQGRSPDPARGRQRARVHADVSEDECPPRGWCRGSRDRTCERATRPAGSSRSTPAAGDDITEVPVGRPRAEPAPGRVARARGPRRTGRRAVDRRLRPRRRRRAAARARLRCERRSTSRRPRSAGRGGGFRRRGSRLRICWRYPGELVGSFDLRVRGVHAPSAAGGDAGTRRSTASRRSSRPAGRCWS